MEHQTTTLGKIQTLEAIYQQGYHNDVVDQALDKIIDLERDQAQRDLTALRKDLSNFENRYHVSSEEFYQRFQQGELGDDGDYFEWSACYDMYKTAEARLHAVIGTPA